MSHKIDRQYMMAKPYGFIRIFHIIVNIFKLIPLHLISLTRFLKLKGPFLNR
jgi:hypothetical protein